MKQYTLEELIEGANGLITTSAAQFEVKSIVMQTLTHLKNMRDALRSGEKVDSDKFAEDLATALGEPPKRRRS